MTSHSWYWMCGFRTMKSPTTIAVLTTVANVSGVLAGFQQREAFIGLDQGQYL